jgi:hypothetical protein
MRRIVWVVAVMVGVLVVAISTAITRPAIGSFLYDYRWWSGLAAGVAVLVLLLVLLGKLLRSPWGSPWRAQVLATATALEGQLSALSGATPGEQALYPAVEQVVQRHLEVACSAAQPMPDQRLPVSQQFLDWWTGGDIEKAFLNLHEAEIALAQLLPDDQIQARIPEVLARLQTIEVTDPRRRAAETQLGSNPTGSQHRAAFHRALKLGLELKDEQHVRLRTFRNIVVTTAVGLMALVVTLCLVGFRFPDAIPLCFGPAPILAPAPGEPPSPVQGPFGVACPSEEVPPTPGTQGRRLPAPGDVTLAALFGLLGGGLSAAITIRNLQRNYRAPLDIPVALTLLKLPSGALSALIGLLFIRGEFIPGMSQLDSQQQILAYAFLFGIAQWLITRTVDQQAEAILAKTPSEAVSGAQEPSPAEGPTGASGQPG